ncbi:phospholipase A [Moraxella nasovis]|uniref:phospholipase A n=1 Tax=Moraxella nasovis TaxID=2904121 RepID=UPI001F611048|nr:phospholipase A [Moraxella nasovis]UNU73745.1 phospholipase A [Moraxella nasovis]
MKLSCAIKALSLSMLALSGAAYANDVASQTDAKSVNELGFDQKSKQNLLEKCTQITVNTTRLACFDQVMDNEDTKVLADKKPIVISQTIKSIFTGDPALVRDDVLSVGLTIEQQAKNTEIVKSLNQRYSPLSLAYDLDKNSEQGLWTARPHNPTYALPLFLNARPNRSPGTPNQRTQDFSLNEMREAELKFQVSLKTKAAEDLFGTDADLWMGYTQQSHWQVYNENSSRPFRAHDYQPEVFVTQPVKADLPFGGSLRMLGAGLVHHSNGENDPLSRSWNKAYLMTGMEWNKLTVMPRLWTRVLKGTDSKKPDDNPDILDYYGYGDIKFIYELDKGKNISGTVRYNPTTHKGALQLDYVRPLGKGVSGYIQFFKGYGQSIIDYNHESTTLGVGVMLDSGWTGL